LTGEPPHGCQFDWGSASEAEESPKRPTKDEQPSSPSVTEDADRYRESGAQPTPLGSTLDATGPDAQPRDVPTPQGDYPAKFDWRVDLKDNTYKYDRLVEPAGSAERARRRNTPFRTTATLNLQPIRILTRWPDESLGSGGGFDKGSQAFREDTRFRGQADSPIPYNNTWERAVAQPTCDTSSGVYNGGGERVPETPPEVHRETAKKHYVVQPPQDTSSGVYDGGGERVPETLPEVHRETAKEHYVVQPPQVTSSGVYDGGGERVPETPPGVNREELKKRYVIRVDKLKLCTAATQSPDSVATQPTTQ